MSVTEDLRDRYEERAAIMEFDNGSVNYATNTSVALYSTTQASTPSYVASIADRTVVPLFTPSTVGGANVDGDSVSIAVQTGNPTTGDSDITVTVYYYVIPV